ncbi:rhomboid family intramembrane serine protease [Marixanthomonas spongiae]|uniref:Rhomboid family intramembrane serine protease n=1 Tax=Marixanthomonas spongiae TaxID=2174845 RepID=A0A2U0HXP1_9FLAO|nr:rhomboid family intramembrane serine protease [Marixanthomonas spongiae]PVW13510.1 rhomboid family intramembrane serine protease [Marixanthomonas spongiae]
MDTNNLTYQFKTSSIVIKLIVINAVIFLAVRLMAFFMGMAPGQLTQWFVLPEGFGSVLLQPWSLLTYAFLHFGFFHILFNMLWLYWFGRFVLNLFSEKRFLTVYLLGAFFGGVLYVATHNVFPALKGSSAGLIGASGAVTAIMVFIATYTPNTEVMIFRFRIKLWHIALVLVLLDLVLLPNSDNAGGRLAHIGGAIFGFVYAQQLQKGNDIGKWFENMIDWVGNMFKPKKKKPFTKVHRNRKTTTKRTTDAQKDANQKKIDAILDKIGKSGYDSLTKAEKDFLFKAGKDD